MTVGTAGTGAQRSGLGEHHIHLHHLDLLQLPEAVPAPLPQVTPSDPSYPSPPSFPLCSSAGLALPEFCSHKNIFFICFLLLCSSSPACALLPKDLGAPAGLIFCICVLKHLLCLSPAVPWLFLHKGSTALWQSLSQPLWDCSLTWWHCPLPESPGREYLSNFPFPTWLQRGVAERIVQKCPRSLKGCKAACPACPAPARLAPRLFLVCCR